MDDLLLFTPSKESHMDKLEDLLKALLKNGLKYHQRNANYSRPAYNTWKMKYLFKTEKCVYNPKEIDWKQFKNYNPQRQQKDARVLQVW